MNNSEIEKGIRAFLIAKLAAEELVLDTEADLAVTAATIGDVQASIHTHTGTDPLPDSIAYVVIQSKAEHDVGALWTGDIAVLVSSPSKIEGHDDTTHAAIVAAVRAALFAQANQADLSAAVLAAAGFTTHGHFFKKPEDGVGEGRRQTKLEFILGLHEVAAP